MKNEEQMLGDVMSEFVQKNKFSIAFSRFFFNLKTFRLDLGIVLLALFSFLLASLLLNFLHFFDFAPVTVFSAVIFLVLKFFLPQKILLSEMSKNDFIVIGFFVLVYVFFHFSLNGLLFDGDQHFYYNYAVKTSELKFLSPSLDELFTNFSIPPLFNFLAAYFYMLFQNEFLLYLLPFVFYFLFILVMLSWFKENGLNVFLLAILIVISPIWLQYSVEFLREMPFIFLLTVFFYLMHRFDKAGENVFLFYSFVAIALALLTKIAGVYLFLFLAAYFVFVKRISLKLLFLPLIVLFAWFVSSPQSILFFLNIFLVVTGLQNRVFEASLIDLFAGLFSFVIFPFYAINVALLLLVKNTRFFVLAVFFLVFMSFSVSMFGYGGLNYYRYAIEFFGISIFIAAFQINLAFKRFAWFANFLIMVFIFSFFNPFMPLLNKILFSFSAIPSLLIDPLFPENAFILVLFFLVQIGLAYYLARFVVKKSLFSFFSKPLQLMLFLMVFNMFSMFYLLFAMGRFGFNIMFYNIPNFFDSIQFFLGLFF